MRNHHLLLIIINTDAQTVMTTKAYLHKTLIIELMILIGLEEPLEDK